MASTSGRRVVVPLTNKSGGGVIAGDVVIIDTANNESFTTTTTGAFTGLIGVAQETIANNATGRVATSGYVALVNVNASVTRGNYGKTHTVAKQATDAGASRVAGAFCQFLTGGTTPTATLFGSPDGPGTGGAVSSDSIWDAKGDLAAGTGADTASKLTVGTNQDILVANSAQSTGLQWVTLQVGRVVRSSGDFTHTGDTNFTDITGASITFTTGARRVALDFSASWYVNNATGTAGLDFVIDGTRPGGTTAGMTTYNQHATASEAVPVHIHYITDVLSAGSHTFKVQAKVFNAAHTVTVQGADPVYVFCAEERPLG